MNGIQDHIETTHHSITAVGMVRGISSTAAETAAIKAEKGKGVAVPETRRTG